MATRAMMALAALLALPADARTLVVKPGADAQQRLQEALIAARPGDTVRIRAGRYALADGLSLDVAGVTVRGDGPSRTILDFTSQRGEGEGVLITSNDVLVRDLAVENPKGNGLKSKGSDGISFVNVRVEWTGGPKATNGAYGVYPVSSRNVLIDRVTVKGASDAGIYVGQSANIIVRNSTAEQNVAGIEIENSHDAEVTRNTATNNAGGILVFDLPDLPQQGGHNVHVHGNRVVANNHVNFAAPGNIVAGVPSGTGVMVMANRDVHVRDNDISGNNGNAVMIVSYQQGFTDKAYNPLPRDVTVNDNRYAGNGGKPGFAGGADIAKAVGGTLPPVMWDGVTRFTVPGGGDGTRGGRVIVQDAPLLNLGLEQHGQSVAEAKPQVTTAAMALFVHPPAAIVLPTAQETRARRK